MFASKKSYREKKDELARVRVQLHALALENEKLEQLVRDSENASVLSTHEDDDDDDSNDQRRRRFSLESPEDLQSALSGMKRMLEAAEEKARREESMRKDIEMQFQTKKHEYLQSAVSGMQSMLTETEMQLQETLKKLEEMETKRQEAETMFAKEIKDYETRIAYLESFVKPCEMKIEVKLTEAERDALNEVNGPRDGKVSGKPAVKSRGCGFF
tara:strand:- start:197 stop:838 length:642 start_codon:yes stop_codon:yes gene_type:complete